MTKDIMNKTKVCSNQNRNCSASLRREPNNTSYGSLSQNITSLKFVSL